MWSLKSTIANAGLGAPISLCFDIYGYRQGRLPRAPDGGPASMSLRAWAALGQGNSFNLNVVTVGVESFTSSLFDEIDTAIHRMRQIYGEIGVGVKWVLHWQVSVADADGLDVVTTEDELDDLLSRIAVDNWAIDLLFPAGWSVPDGSGGSILGRSAVDGPCPTEKEDAKLKGSAAGLVGPLTSSRTASHEIGHYLSLAHQNDSKGNLMCQTGKASKPTWQAVALSGEQPHDVKMHCMVLKWWVQG